MQGLNRQFMENPFLFLALHPLRIRARAEQGSPFVNLAWANNPPVFQFDISVQQVGVELIPFVPHPKTHIFGTQRPINAYWLDYEAGQDRVVDLNNIDADYVFTPMLDGCYIGIDNGLICHCAGNDAMGYNRGNVAAMRQLANAALGGGPTIGFDSTPADATQMTFIGVRDAVGWHWYVQGHEVFWGNHGVLEPVFALNNATVPPILRGQELIEIVDMTLG